MKKLFFLIGLLSFLVSSGQFSPTGTKTAFKNGIALGTKDSTGFNSADSLAVTIDRNGNLLYRSTDGYWKKLAIGGDLNNYVLVSRFLDSLTQVQGRLNTKLNISDYDWSSLPNKPSNFSTTYALSNDVRDSIQARIKYSDTNSLSATQTWVKSGYVPQTRTLTINGTTQDLTTNRTWTIPGYNLDTVSRFGGVKSIYRAYQDSLALQTQITNNATNIALKVNISDTAAMLTGYKTYYPRNSLSLTTTGTSGASTYNSTTGAFNIPTYTLSGLGGIPIQEQRKEFYFTIIVGMLVVIIRLQSMQTQMALLLVLANS